MEIGINMKTIGKICTGAVAVFVVLLIITAFTQPPPKILKTRAETLTGMTKYGPSTDPHPPTIHNSSWNAPVIWDCPVNTAGAEDSPYMSADGKLFFFFFTPNASIPANKQVNDGVTGVWVAKHDGLQWNEPQRVFTGWDVLDGCPFYLNGALWFCSVRDSNTPEMYSASFNETTGNITNIAKLPPPLSGYSVGEMCISLDGKELYFGSQRAGGKGGYDIWMCTNLGEGQWSEPVNLPMNTDKDELMPFITFNGNELWWNQGGYGAPEVWRAFRNGNSWGTPEKIISGFAGEPTLDAQGNIYFVHHYYSDHIIEADIMVCTKK